MRKLSVLLVAMVVACSSKANDATAPPPTSLTEGDGFFDRPWPSDARLTPDGAPDLAGFPDPGVPILGGLKTIAMQRKGFPVVPVGYFRFTSPPAPRDPDAVVQGRAIVLVDVDPASPERGRTFPVVAHTPNADPYVPESLLAVAARPGIVLAPNRKHAFVVTTDVGMADGRTPVPPPALVSPTATDAALLAPMWETLDAIGLPRNDVVAATVFTTGDVVADNAALGDRVLTRFAPDLRDFTQAPGAPDGLCHVRATLELPQFQRGTPLFETDGLFDLDADGVPRVQRTERVPVSIAVPRGTMPAGGWPLVLYFHGSGGVSREFIDGGDPPEPDSTWPGPVLASRGFAVAGAALPVSPERVPGAGDTAYLNIDNVAATRDTFRQGILESRMLLSALLRATIPASALAGCATADARFDAAHVHAQGQSMGGMYANLVSATEPRIRLAVPTGAGGFWVYFILRTHKIPGAAGLVSLVLKTPETLTFLHPAMHVFETALEPVDPMVSMPRLAHRALDGHPARPVYEPVGKDDSYFPTEVYDAMALAYGHPRAGDDVWPTMGDAQALVGLAAPVAYPVSLDVTAASGARARTTGVVVQFLGDGVHDPHGIYRRLDAVIQQYGCFHTTFRDTGVAVVPAPAPRGTPCAP
jgi:hypothetical protein